MTDGLNLYIRFGEIPTDEKSKIHNGDEILGEEPGVSVYRAIKGQDDLYYPELPKDSIGYGINDYFYFLFSKSPVYLVTGDEIWLEGHNREPLIKNVRIIKDLTEAYKYRRGIK